MSEFSEIRNRHGNDVLTDTISDLILKVNLNDAITDQTTIADKISPVKVFRSVIEITDFDMMRGYAKTLDPDHTYRIGFEPDNNNVRLDLKFDHGGEYLTDYSKLVDVNYEQINKTTIGYDTDLPVILKAPEDDGVTTGDTCSILDGLQHYFRLPKNNFNSIKQMVTDGKPGFTIPFRVYPLSILNEQRSGNTKRANLFYYIENDQVEYATKAELDDTGKVHFFVRHNSETFYLSTPETVITLPENIPDYFAPDYDPTDYNAAPDTYSILFPVPFIDLGFEFNFSNKQLTIFLNGAIVAQTIINPIPLVTVGDFPAGALVPSDTLPFPPYQDDPPEPPPAGTATQEPFSKVYEVTNEAGSVKINKVTVSGQTEIYNVVGGEPVADPLTIKYNVPEGVGSDQTNDYATIYDLAGVSSTGNIDDEANEWGYGQYIRTIDSVLHNKKVTRIRVELNGLGNPVGGTAYIGIIKADGTYIIFGAGIDPATIPDAWTAYQRTGNQEIATQYALQVGDAVGVIWIGSTSGDINIRRAGTGGHYSTENNGAYSCQNHIENNGGVNEWQNPNPDFSMAALIETGGEVVSQTPWLTMDKGSYLIIGEQFSTGSAVYNVPVTQVELKVKKKSGTTGTLYLQIVTSGGTVKKTLKTWDIATELGTTDPTGLNLVYTDVQNTTVIGSGERLCLVTPSSGTGTMNTGGEVYVMSNRGNNTPTTDETKNHNSTSSYIIRRSITGTWATYDNQLDITGKIYTGGNDFTGYIALNDNRKRVGILADTSISSFVSPSPGKIVTRVIITGKTQNNPANGAIYCRLRSASGDLKATIGQRDISEVLAVDTSLEFVNIENNIPMLIDDQISIEYDQGTAVDALLIRINKNVFEAANTILFESLVANMAQALPVSDRDLAAQVFTGGQTDQTARPKRGIILKPNSALIGRAISEARLKMKRTGIFESTDTVSVRILKGTDKSTVITLDSRLCNDISDSVFIEYIFQNTGNAYSLVSGDLISIECNFGDSTKYIEVKTAGSDIYDSTKTVMFDYNDLAWNENPNDDLTGSLWIGGYMVFPDPSIPIPPNPYHYDHAWYIGSSTTPDSGGIIDPTLLKPEAFSYTNMIVKQFRIYTMLLTEIHLDNYFRNRFTISSIDYGHPEVCGHEYVNYQQG